MTKPLSYLSDAFRWLPWKWEIQRNDELSGSADGRIWQAQLAPPIWVATVRAGVMTHPEAERLDALVRGLDGTREAFLLCSPLFRAPASDPTGAGLSGASVQVSSIATGRRSLGLSGLPAGYQLRAGDKLSIDSGAAMYFGEVTEDSTATAGGAIAALGVFPAVQMSISAPVAVSLVAPACRVVVRPGTHAVASADGAKSAGCSFQVVQKR